MPHSLARGYIPRVDVMLYLVMMPNLMNQNICSIVTFVDVFLQVLHSWYQHTGFDIDVAIKFLAHMMPTTFLILDSWTLQDFLGHFLQN